MAPRKPAADVAHEMVEGAAHAVDAAVQHIEAVVEPVAEKVIEAVVTLVRMVRDRLDESDEGPTEADVHPDEVGNMKAGGWTEAE